MWESITAIKSKYPVPFWIAMIVVFPVGIAVLIMFLLSGRKPSDRDLLDTAANSAGKAEVHKEVADEIAKTATKEHRRVQIERQKLKMAIKVAKAKAKKQKAKQKEVADADSWDDIDKQAGVK